MATIIKLKQTNVPGRVPTTGQLEFGEVALNVADGKLFFKKLVSNTETIVEFSADPQDLLNLIKTVDGANSGLDADLLDGQSGEYYLDYNNFTNVPPATLDLTLDGKVTGNAFSNTGVMTLFTELANTGVTPGTYGSASLVPIITIDEDGRITVANTTSVAGVSQTSWYTANNTFVIRTADGGAFRTLIQDFNNISTNDITANNIIVSGLVDGRDIAADGAKLDRIEEDITVTITGDVEGTTTSNTGTIVVTAELTDTGVAPGTYGSASQIPIITVDVDGRVTLLSNTAVAGVENFSWISANNTLRLETGDGTVRFVNVDNFTNLAVNGDITVTGTVDGRDVSVDGAKLDGIEPGATADQTASEILNSIKTVDGTGSGLDADRLDGEEGTYYLDYNNFTNVPSNTDILESVKDVDGVGSGLDADLLDGLQASEILAQAANTSSSQIGDGQITITAGNALIGGGIFTVNQFSDQEITINHADTSSAISANNDNGSVIQDVIVDTYGHVTAISSIDLDTRYYTETESDARFALQTTQIIAGAGLTGGGTLSSDVTISHADTSSQSNSTFLSSNNEFIASLDVDTFGHVVSVTKEQRSYLTTSEADSRYVNVTGDTMTGNLTVNADTLMTGKLTVNAEILQDFSKFVSVENSTVVAGFPLILLQIPTSQYGGAELTVVVTRGTDKQITKMLVVHDGTTASATEYGTISTSSDLATIDVSLSGGNVNVAGFSNLATLTSFRVFGTLIV